MGGGSISAMISTLKNNRIQQRDKKLGHLEYKKSVPIGNPLKFKNKFSKEEAIKFIQGLKETRRKTILRDIVLSILCICIVGVLFYSIS